MVMFLVGAIEDLWDLRSRTVIDSGTTSSSTKEILFFLMLIEATSMEVGVEPFTALA